MEENRTGYKSVIFDMDDTLLNTDNLAPFIAAIQNTGKGTDENNVAWKELFKHIPDCTMYEGMQEVFDFIRENNIQVCLCSNSPLKRIERLVKAFKIPIPKHRLIGAYSCGNRMYPLKKPNPAQYLKAMEIMGDDP